MFCSRETRVRAIIYEHQRAVLTESQANHCWYFLFYTCCKEQCNWKLVGSFEALGALKARARITFLLDTMAFKAMMKRSVSMARRESDREVDEDGLPSISASPTLRRSDSKRDSNNGGMETSALDRFATLKDKLKLVR